MCSLVMLLIQLALFARLQRHLRPVTLVAGGFIVMAAGFAQLRTSAKRPDPPAQAFCSAHFLAPRSPW